MDPAHKADSYLVRHIGHDEEEGECCSLELCNMEETAFAEKLKLHHDPEQGWTSLALIEGLVNHLRWTQQHIEDPSLPVEQAIKHLERAWTALASEHPQENGDPR